MLELFQKLFTKIQYNKPKIAIVGDMMIDEYYNDCSVHNLSSEFPIPVIKSTSQYPSIATLGGSGNLANQFKNLNVDITTFGFIDGYSKEIYSNKINIENLILINGKIPIKRRYYERSFPLFRLDIESNNYGLNKSDLEDYQNQLYSKFLDQYESFDAILLSDYNKGTFINSDNNWILNNSITIVDPKTMPISRWKNCKIFKPNKKEAEILSGLKSWQEQCDFFQKQINCESVVITLGEEGVCGKYQNEYFYHANIRKTKCESVIGGGDCFMAWLGLTTSLGLSVIEASQLSYEAGAIYVQKKYNKPISQYDIIKRFDPTLAKYVTLDDLQNRNYKLVMCNGCFDILHSGHLEMLKFAKNQGDKLIVAVNDDSSVAKLKVGRPVNKLEDRLKMLANLEIVDFVISFSEDNPLNLIKSIHPDVLVKGAEYQLENVVGYGIVPKILLAPMLKGYSTSKIMERYIQ